MIQYHTDPKTCANCHKPMKTSQNGGIRHTKTEEGYITGYLCKQCSNYSPNRSEQYSYIRANYSGLVFASDTEEPMIPKKKEWPKTKPKTAQYNTYNPKPGSEISWLSAWFDDQDLKKMFKEFKQMRSFANSYGYSAGMIKEMKNHKAKLIKDWLWEDE